MKKLVSTNEAAQILGISVQGVHYRIKKQHLEAIKKDGKTFVYLDNTITSNYKIKSTTQNESEIIRTKNEQIELLKETIKWMKKQYKQEIKRLDSNQNKIIDVFKSEIILLQQAYNEMQNIYKIEHKNDKEEYSFDMMSIKDFYIFMKQYNKTDLQIKSLILDRIKQEDKRFIYNIKTKELLIYKSDFIDLI